MSRCLAIHHISLAIIALLALFELFGAIYANLYVENNVVCINTALNLRLLVWICIGGYVGFASSVLFVFLGCFHELERLSAKETSKGDQQICCKMFNCFTGLPFVILFYFSVTFRMIWFCYGVGFYVNINTFCKETFYSFYNLGIILLITMIVVLCLKALVMASRCSQRVLYSSDESNL